MPPSCGLTAIGPVTPQCSAALPPREIMMSIDRTSTFFRCSRSAPGLEPSGILSDSPVRQAEMLLLGAETAVSTQPVGDMAAVKEPLASGRIYVRSVPSVG